MFCPECGAEYRPEFTECGECGVDLVPVLPREESEDPDSRTVAVFRTTDSMLLPIVKSLLESSEIEFFIQGEEALGLLPVGAMGSSVGRATLGATVHVFERDADTVRALLSEVSEGTEPDAD